ncbi:probable pectinesterase/pectinesterase inhibitor 51 [Chenopodium quinoa]|uniref:probable pectinesterase/pectinesterase inhibitor 51 n=1 Tax=Chenopodium quinoa TaxID=63459 RepID=UPI000B78FF13|nr:probable pectinesterase/pectinesterase inhibitor 51 [Chenopodium quinoa]
MTTPFTRNPINANPFLNSYPHFKPHQINNNNNYKKILFLLLSMAFSLFFLLFLSLSSLSSAHRHPKNPRVQFSDIQPSIRQACRATRFPDACQSMLAGRASKDPTPAGIIQLAFQVSTQNLKTGQAMVQEILDASAHNPNRSRAAQTCLEVLGNSQARSSAAEDALARGKLKDARALGSAALSYQYDCWSGLKYVNDSAAVNGTMSFFDTVLITSTSNALSMLRALDALGPDLASWTPPRTERDGFWEPVVSGSESVTLKFGSLSSSFKEADATVCAGGGCKYEKLQDAVDGAPENLDGGKKYVIKIKEGVYDEIVRVPFNKKNLVFLGDGMGKTVITGSLSTGIQGITTYNTATVGVLGDGFMASGLTIQNTAGPDAHQAVAFRSDSDFSYVENCEFLGNQDTIYVHSLRQLFKSCRIEGNVDFIFGNAAAIFQDCTILVRPRQLKPASGETNAISAHGRTDPAQTTGFAFQGCHINGTEEYMKLYNSKPSKHKNYLGRPWKMYSRTVYINSNMEALITPAGWLPWSGDFALSTLYYGEVGNTGPGAGLSNRVPWSRQIPAEHIFTFSVQNFLQGDEWITTAS